MFKRRKRDTFGLRQWCWSRSERVPRDGGATLREHAGRERRHHGHCGRGAGGATAERASAVLWAPAVARGRLWAAWAEPSASPSPFVVRRGNADRHSLRHSSESKRSGSGTWCSRRRRARRVVPRPVTATFVIRTIRRSAAPERRTVLRVTSNHPIYLPISTHVRRRGELTGDERLLTLTASTDLEPDCRRFPSIGRGPGHTSTTSPPRVSTTTLPRRARAQQERRRRHRRGGGTAAARAKEAPAFHRVVGACYAFACLDRCGRLPNT